jgi:hypothetical protein
MKFFGLGAAAPLTLGVAMQALIGQETVSAEQVDAANTELATAGLKGAQLVPGAVLDELTTKAGRTETAEASVSATTAALAAAGVADLTALVAERDAYKLKADKFDKAPGASHTTPTLAPGASDVNPVEPDADQKALDALPHNQAIAGHPMFGARQAPS